MAVEQLPAAARASQQSEHFRELMTMIRSRTDATVKGLAAVGTAAVSGIGYATLADVFPYHGPWYPAAGLGVGLIAMVVAVVLLVHRFEHIGDTIITYPDPERTREQSHLKTPEYTTLIREYKEMAKLNEVDSLRAYNARAHRFERLADGSSAPDTAAVLRARADAIRAEVIAIQDRAVVFILRERAKTAFFHKRVIGLLALFLIGWYGTALAADAIQAERAKAEAAASSASSSRLHRKTAVFHPPARVLRPQ